MRSFALLSVWLYLGVLSQVNAAAYDNTGTGAGTAPDNALYEVLSRVEQLQSEVQQLRGVVEEQAQTISDLERKQRNMYSDLDGRVQALTPATPTATPVVASTPAPANSAAPASVAAVATPAVGAVTPAPAPVPASSAAVAVPAAVTASPVAATPAKIPEKERYQTAYNTLVNGHTDQAIKMFESLLVDYPAGEFADNSQYWLGEAFKINREYDKARAAFNKVITLYPNSAKVPDALLKLGYIEADLQNNVKAREYLNRVNNSYAGTTAAHLAAKKLAQMTQ